ncbi:hypothetical protein SLA2020_337890 [Shorea laevis]
MRSRCAKRGSSCRPQRSAGENRPRRATAGVCCTSCTPSPTAHARSSRCTQRLAHTRPDSATGQRAVGQTRPLRAAKQGRSSAVGQIAARARGHPGCSAVAGTRAPEQIRPLRAARSSRSAAAAAARTSRSAANRCG